jgi:2-polyprenyl-3-methyl-5-hydroxy-6-metoxy-1,4-benzoquinol methylase
MIKISGGIEDDGVVIGNAFDKYGSNAVLVKAIMRAFAKDLSDLVSSLAPQSIHEVGCGEGYWTLHWNKIGLSARGSDFSSKVIQIARENALNQGISSSIFQVASIYELDESKDSADLLVCCEVFEHLEDPIEAMRVLQRIAKGHLILSVPREPLWRVLNLFRLKYLSSLGNTPGHLQHWSKKQFIDFVSRYFEVIEVRSPLPWTMLLCRPLG